VIKYSRVLDKPRYIPYANVVNNIEKIYDKTAISQAVSLSFAKNFTNNGDMLRLAKSKAKYVYFHDRCRFNSHVEWPTGLQKIHFGKTFNKPIKSLPESTRYLSFCRKSKFNQGIEFPAGLITISFGALFNRPIDLSHTKVTTIYFPPDSIFNEIIIVPNTLRCITFGNAYDRPIRDILLKPSLFSVKFHRLSQFHQIIDCTDSQIHRLTLGQFYHTYIIPDRLRELVLPTRSLMRPFLHLTPHLNQIVVHGSL
jgi:hypothetical protein